MTEGEALGAGRCLRHSHCHEHVGGASSPALQAEPVGLLMPLHVQQGRAGVSPSAFSKVKWALPGSRFWPGYSSVSGFSPLSVRLRDERLIAATSSLRSAAMRADSFVKVLNRGARRPLQTCNGGCVDGAGRTERSWPPPCRTGGHLHGTGCNQRADAYRGRRILWPGLRGSLPAA